MGESVEEGGVSISDVMDCAERASLAELSELALFANAGGQAVDTARLYGPGEMCRQLATQTLTLIRRIPALEPYRSVFEDLSRGVMPDSEKLAAARGLMALVAVMFRQTYERREQQHDRDRGVRRIL